MLILNSVYSVFLNFTIQKVCIISITNEISPSDETTLNQLPTTINVKKKKCLISFFFLFTLLPSCISQGKFRVGHELNMKSNVLCEGSDMKPNSYPFHKRRGSKIFSSADIQLIINESIKLIKSHHDRRALPSFRRSGAIFKRMIYCMDIVHRWISPYGSD